MKLKKGDNIKVLIGKDKGKTGVIEKVYPARGKVLIIGINEFKRHLKSKSQNQKSEIVTITKPLPVSNVALVCPKCKKLTRISFKMENNKSAGSDIKKIRICAKCKKEIN